MSETSVEEIKSDIKTLLVNQKEIKEQVKLTNGRVRNLEGWKFFMIGGLTVLSTLVIPMFLAWFGSQLK